MTTLLALLAVLQDGDTAAFKPDLTRPPDFRDFWKGQLEAATKDAFDVRMAESVDPAKPAPANRVWDVKFKSADGKTDVWAWYSAPSGAGESKKVPAIVTIPAFNGRRGAGAPRYPDACGLVAGYRGEGDLAWPNDWITRGLDKIENSVFRIHYLNMVNAIRFLKTRPEVDPKKIFLQGSSLGGAMCFVVAGLMPDDIAGIVAGVPGMDYYYYRDARPAESSFRQMEQFVEKHPLAEKEKILRILSYYAPINFALEVRCEVLMSCGGKDKLCYPKMVYAVYNHLACPKEIKFYPEGNHGGGPGLSTEWPAASRQWLAERLKK